MAIDSVVIRGQRERRSAASFLGRLLAPILHPGAEVERLKEEVLDLARQRWNPAMWPISLHKEESFEVYSDSVEEAHLVNYTLLVGPSKHRSGYENSDIRALKALRNLLSQSILCFTMLVSSLPDWAIPVLEFDYLPLG